MTDYKRLQFVECENCGVVNTRPYYSLSDEDRCSQCEAYLPLRDYLFRADPSPTAMSWAHRHLLMTMISIKVRRKDLL